jgi:hypothetical protein
MTAFVARSTRAVLKRKLLMRVAPGFMGCTVNSRRFIPTFVHPFTVTPTDTGKVVSLSLSEWMSGGLKKQ